MTFCHFAHALKRIVSIVSINIALRGTLFFFFYTPCSSCTQANVLGEKTGMGEIWQEVANADLSF